MEKFRSELIKSSGFFSLTKFSAHIMITYVNERKIKNVAVTN